MLENVRQSGAEMLVLLDASGTAPDLHTHNGALRSSCTMIVVRSAERVFVQYSRKSDAGAALRRGGFQMGSQHKGRQKRQVRRGST